MFYQLDTLSEKLGFFLYLFIGCYKCNDVVMHEKSQVNFQELKRIYLINIYMLFAGWEVRMVKNCDRGLENTARGRRPVNNIFIVFKLDEILSERTRMI